jgi:hypothetical protein
MSDHRHRLLPAHDPSFDSVFHEQPAECGQEFQHSLSIVSPENRFNLPRIRGFVEVIDAEQE